ncbi:MAG: DUF1353 domain-containing protein [Aliifodinibius sp.]|nr:DUF1353 domain-containing protein [Fodinibius sp.]NIV09966.1 DUF1353 domain-containing protein [Fodinibius sp.]NIY23496.1 DUF1353 domain-containing protein [Fodinibius sp.]
MNNVTFPDQKYPMPVYEPIPLITEEMSYTKRIKQAYTAPPKHRLLKPYFIWYKKYNCWIAIPAGFVIDGASIPRYFWWAVPPGGVFLRSSIPHDYGYQKEHILLANSQGRIAKKKITKAEIDIIFHDLSLEVTGVPISSWVAYEAVKYFGGFTWNGYRRDDIANPKPEIKYETIQDLV